MDKARFKMGIMDTDIAIIGLSCRFPGANNPEEFWKNISNGVESISFFKGENKDGKIRAWGALSGIEEFDADFFGISNFEAKIMDPQQRIFLECAWEAMESAGYNPELFHGKIGIFGGSAWSTYFINNIHPKINFHSNRSFFESMNDFQLMINNDKDYLTTRISYKLGLRGPSVNVQSACSTSLVAVHLACQGILAGECEMALAGGVTIIVPQDAGYLYQQDMIFSPDGHCRAFDQKAQGAVFGNGAGIVLLKSLRSAFEDNDNILAIIKATAVNNDGSTKVGYSAPSLKGQSDVIKEALILANVPSESISYIEAHGTATPLGDPIEIEALTRAFETEKKQFCALGTVKTNIGHLAWASGIAGLIKVILSLKNKRIPPTLHFTKPNSAINFKDSPFFVNNKLCDWVAERKFPRRAGVSAFGLGGTNAHVIVEEMPEIKREKAPSKKYIATISARDEKALDTVITKYLNFLENNPQINLADLCYTLNIGRKHFKKRLAFVVNSREDFLSQLAGPKNSLFQSESSSKIAFLFSGQGDQYLGMGKELYARHPLFKQIIDKCEHIFYKKTSKSLIELLFKGDLENKDLEYAQPALIAFECALAELWISWGIKPDVIIGHSLGEYAGAYIAGTISLENLMEIIIERARLMSTIKDGKMAVILTDRNDVRKFLNNEKNVSIAAINSPQNVVISGKNDEIIRILQKVNNSGRFGKKLNIDSASHSVLMRPIKNSFKEFLRKFNFSKPQVPFISTVKGRLVDIELTKAEYWAEHLTGPVLFENALKVASEIGTFIEIGPDSTLIKLALNILGQNNRSFISSLKKGVDKWEHLLFGLGSIYKKGKDIDWEKFESSFGEVKQRINLPTYPFQRRRFWVDSGECNESSTEVKNEEILSKQNDFYKVNWELRPQASYGMAQFPFFNEIFRKAEIFFKKEIRGKEYAYSKQIFRELELMSLNYIKKAFCDMGWDLKPGNFFSEIQLIQQFKIIQRHERLFKRILKILEEEKIIQQIGKKWKVLKIIKPIHVFKPENQAYPEQKLLIRCGERLSYVLQGKSDPLELLFPNGDMKDLRELYRNSPVLKLMNNTIRETISFIQDNLSKNSGIKILEIGAGTGGTTESVLPCLNSNCTHYIFSDISKAFLAEARERFKTFSFLDYRLLDIEGDLEKQNFANERYDLVIASNVLHTTEKINVTIKNVQKLLAPGGVLVFIEGCAPTNWVDLTFGLLEGWWTFNDFVIRKSYPLLPPSKWKKILKENAFSEVRYLNSTPLGKKLLLPQSFILARKDPKNENGGKWLIFSDKNGIADELAKKIKLKNDDYILVRVGNKFKLISKKIIQINPRKKSDFVKLLKKFNSNLKIVYLWSQLSFRGDDLIHESSLGWEGLLNLVQSFENSFLSLYVITKKGQALKPGDENDGFVQAILWGMMRTIALEYPELKYKLIDIDKNDGAVECLYSELINNDSEAQVGFRANERYVARLSPLFLEQGIGPLSLKKDATYLITGGFGGLGLLLAERMIEKGARFVVLVGRNGPKKDAQEKIEKLRKKAMVISFIIDVSDRKKVNKLVKEINKSNLPELKGIIHAAGSIDDGIVQKLTTQRFRNVMLPKVNGTWNLHLATIKKNLDFFVMFSSAVSLIGNSGQANHAAANAFLDSFAFYRRQKGLSALTVNWGAWEKVGTLSQNQTALNRLKQIGIKLIEPRMGLNFLELFMSKPIQQIGFFPIDWKVFIQENGLKSVPFFDLFVDTQETPPIKSFQEIFLETSNKALRFDILINFIREIAEKLLGISDSNNSAITSDQNFTDSGMDSLTAIMLRNKLQSELGVQLPSNIAFLFPTVNKLAEHLIKQPIFESPKLKKEARLLLDSPALSKEIFRPISMQQKRWLMLANKNYGRLLVPILFKGKLKKENFRCALYSVLELNEILRISFPNHFEARLMDTESVMLKNQELFFDLKKMKGKSLKSEIKKHADFLRLNPPNFRKRPSWQIRVLEISDSEFLVLLFFQHLEFDGTSVSIFIDQLRRKYKNPNRIDEKNLGYKDYVAWQNRYIQNEIGKERAAFKKFYARIKKVDFLPGRIKSKKTISNTSRCFSFGESGLFSKLKQRAKNNNVSVFSLLFCAYAQLIGEITRNRKVVIGSIFEGRAKAEFCSVIGPFVAPFPVFIDLNKKNSMLIKKIHDSISFINERSFYPVSDLIQNVKAFQGMEMDTYFSDAFIMLNNYKKESDILEPKVEVLESLGPINGRPEFNDLSPKTLNEIAGLFLIIDFFEQELRFNFWYHEERFSRQQILKWVEKYQKYLKIIIDGT